MKMLTAIINRRDAGTVCEALTAAGFYYTRVATSGGLLSAGNTTLLLGVENSRMDAALDILRSQSTTRTEPVQSSDAQLPTHPDSVVVGGATVFVLDVNHTEKF